MSLARLKKKVIKPNRILGVDASTYSYGWGLLEAGELKSYGLLKYEGKDRLARLADSYLKVQALLKHIGPVDLIMQEQAVGSINLKTGLYLAQGYGAVIAATYPYTKEFDMVNPNEWQAWLGVKSKSAAVLKKEYPDATKSWINEEARKERKRRNIEWVNKRAGTSFEYEQNDTVDGVCISYFAAGQYET